MCFLVLRRCHARRLQRGGEGCQFGRSAKHRVMAELLDMTDAGGLGARCNIAWKPGDVVFIRDFVFEFTLRLLPQKVPMQGSSGGPSRAIRKYESALYLRSFDSEWFLV